MYNNPILQEIYYNVIGDSITTIEYSHAFQTKSEYYQYALQFEYELPWDIQFAGQSLETPFATLKPSRNRRPRTRWQRHRDRGRT